MPRKHCQKIIAELDEAKREILRLSETPLQRLRINAATSLGIHLLTSELNNFLADYPDIEIDLCLRDDSLGVINDEGDLTNYVAPAGTTAKGSRLLAPYRRIICATPDYCDRHGHPENPAVLESHLCLALSPLDEDCSWQLEEPQGLEEVAIKQRIRVNNRGALDRAVLASLGIGPLSAFLVHNDVRTGKLINLLPGYWKEREYIFALEQQGNRHRPLVRNFIEFLDRQFAQGAELFD